MKGKFLATMLVLALLALAGCGGGNSPPPLFVTDILSKQAFDGDIRLDLLALPARNFIITQGSPQSVRAGVDLVAGAEYRAFLDFPLGTIPANAFIESATLDIFIDNIFVQPLTGSIPIFIDLVTYPPFRLDIIDFSSSFLATTSIVPPISLADLQRHVRVNVTSLMVEAQRQSLAHFQVRILLDPRAASGFIDINESQINLAPLLTVTYS